MSHTEVHSVDLLAEMRAAQEHESYDGARMLLTLIDLRDDPVKPAQRPAEDPDGAVYAELVDRYRDELVPWARDDDQGALITVLKTIGFTAFEPTGDA